MSKKEIQCDLQLKEDVKTTPPEDVQSDCLYCYVDDKKCSPGTIANFAGLRRECVIVNGRAEWRNFYAASANEQETSNDEFDCPNCYVDGAMQSPGTIANFAGQRRECVVINGQGQWRDL